MISDVPVLEFTIMKKDGSLNQSEKKGYKPTSPDVMEALDLISDCHYPKYPLTKAWSSSPPVLYQCLTLILIHYKKYWYPSRYECEEDRNLGI